MEFRWPQYLFAVVTGMMLASSVHAAELELLLMPGEVIEGHAKVEAECSGCHVAFARERQNSLCIDCHQVAGADQLAGRGFHGRDPQARSADCADCHTEHQGRTADIVGFDAQGFAHDFTDFELVASHAEAECEDCHKPDDLFRDAPGECVDCHRTDDVHEGGLGEDCASCHMPERWEVVEFEHQLETGFALLFGHADATCDSCHLEQSFSDTDSACVACHLDDDVHAGSLGNDCASCHVAERWEAVEFEHQLETGFALLFGHADVTCDSCHLQQSFSNTDSACVACHLDDDAHAGLLGNDCASCHDEVRWTKTRFRHDDFSDFLLLGSHVSLSCEACHSEPTAVSNPGSDCIDCHRDDDPHEGQLGDACASCHNDNSWLQNVRFDHDFTVFPLLGEHREAACTDCHENARFSDAPVACGDCHSDADIHNGVLGNDCGACHTPADWALWRFDHFVATEFELDGAHEQLQCADCHSETTAAEQRTSSRCIDCHRSDDVHAGEFGKACGRCHTTQSFRGAEQLWVN